MTGNASPLELAHHGITVSDLDATSAFFADVLGFLAQERIDLDEAFSAGITGIQGAAISVVHMQGPGFTVELLQYHGPADRKSASIRPCDAGAAHLALYAPNLRDVVDRAAAYGWLPAGDIQLIATGSRRGGRAVYLHDADGAVLELVQRP